MIYIVIGLVLFVGMHFVPLVRGVRDGLVAPLGAGRYRAVFSLVSIAGVALMFYGHSKADIAPLWDVPHWARDAVIFLMPVVFFLLAAAEMKTVTRRVVRHPMLIGVCLWAGLHLLNNGDVGSLLLFGGFGGYAVIAMISAERRGSRRGVGSAHGRNDIKAVAAAGVIYTVVLYAHGFLFGEAVL